MGFGEHGGFGNTAGRSRRYRLGRKVPETDKSFNMMLDKTLYATAIANKYRINLKSSGKKVEIAFDQDLPMGVAGKTSALDPYRIVLGPAAFVSEEELANIIAHELNHVRSFARGGRAPERTAYSAGNALASYIRGER